MTSSVTTKRFIVLGDAGAGKSSFINFLYNYYNGTRELEEIFCEHPKVKIAIPSANWTDCLDEKYKNNKSEHNIDDQTQSQTQLCTTYLVGRKNDFLLEIIDTPGFNDTNGSDVDTNNLKMIEKALKGVLFLNGIIIVVNGSSPRLGVSFKNFLHMLHQIWPNDLMNNCVAILTNCDELSVNLDSSVLERDLNIDKKKTFHLQNSLFRWNRKLEPKKTVRRFQQDFEDNLGTVASLLRRLDKFEGVSTKSFTVGAIKISLIENCINESIHNMVDLLEKYKEQQVAKAGIEGARHTMEHNKQWDRQHEIHAVRWVEIPQGRSSSPRRSLHQQPQNSWYNEQRIMKSKDQGANPSKVNAGGERGPIYNDRCDQYRSESNELASKTIPNNMMVGDHYASSQGDGSPSGIYPHGLHYESRAGGSQQVSGAEGLQQGSEAGGSQQVSGVEGLQQGPEAGESQQVSGADGLQQGSEAGGAQHGPVADALQQGPEASGSQQGPVAGGLQQGPKAGGSQHGSVADGLQQEPEAGESQQGSGAGGPQHESGVGGSQHGSEASESQDQSGGGRLQVGPEARSSQHESGADELQGGLEAGGLQRVSGVGGSQQGCEASVSQDGSEIGRSQQGSEAGGSPYGREAGGPYDPVADSGRYGVYDSSVGYRDENGRRDAYSGRSLLRICLGLGDPERRSSGSSHEAVYRQQQTKIQVTLPDNEARAQHKYAQRQENRLQERSHDLVDEEQCLKRSLMLQLEHLRKQVAELRSINKNYDIVQRNHDLLTAFRDIIKYMGDAPEMLSYYNDTVAVLSTN
ncbi:unnamed protein product [Adineta steineri]|uniref:G domain-containing protein n=1 Tax=Adineta steineri TaxID=433720 RepID=A0A813PF74_9BILA|nr:unnamed protein product [Adineta steineri]CAF3799551.1 unnamed protein product [Adineta steineri]